MSTDLLLDLQVLKRLDAVRPVLDEVTDVRWHFGPSMFVGYEDLTA